MKIKMRTSAAGPLGNYASGHVYEVDDTIAERFIAGGYAEAVAPPPAAPPEASGPPEEIKKPAVESAAIEQPETAVLPAARPRRFFHPKGE